MKYLIIGTVANRPHLEVSGEIAFTLKEQGHNVSFCWLGNETVWSEWGLSLPHRLLGCSFNKRVADFLDILADNGVEIVPPPKLTTQEKQDIQTWARQPIKNQKALRLLTFKSATLGMGVASSIISLLRNSEYNPANDAKRVGKALESSAILYTLTEKLIVEEKPENLVTFNGRFATARPIVQAGKQAGLKVIRHDLGSTIDKYALYEDTLHDFSYITKKIATHWETSVDPKKEEKVKEFYAKKRAGVPVAFSATGGNTYLAKQEKGTFPPKVKGKKRVVFFTSSDDEFAAIFDEDGTERRDQHDATKDLISAVSKLDNIELVMRLHPNLANKSEENKAKWYAYEQEGITMVKENDVVDTYALLESADIIATYGSSIGMEAGYNGIPVMLLGEGISTYEHIKGIYTALSEKDITQILTRPNWKPVKKEDTYPYGYYYYTHGIPYKFYKPKTPTSGTFMGKELPWESRVFKFIRTLKHKLS